MILVTGATGALGTATIDFLLQKTSPDQIAALVRDEAKAAPLLEKGISLRIGNYDDLASLVRAMDGINQLLFVSGSDIAARDQQHLNVVEAAKTAKVGHVVYTSFMRRNETETSPIAFVAKSHLLAEEALQASGLSHTILRNGLYMDMLPLFLGPQVLETGVIFQPSGEGRAAFVLRNDLAEATAHILTSPTLQGKTYELTGAASWSYGEVATQLSAIAGKNVSHVSPTLEVFKAELSKAGVPAEYIGLFAGFATAIQQGEFADTSEALAKLLGRDPVSLENYLRQVYAS